MADDYKQISSETVTKTRQKLEKPKLYKVILLNDDYTPMEYVVKLIKMVCMQIVILKKVLKLWSIKEK